MQKCWHSEYYSPLPLDWSITILPHLLYLFIYLQTLFPNPFEDKFHTSSTSPLAHQHVCRKTMDILPKSHNATVTPKKADTDSVR